MCADYIWNYKNPWSKFGVVEHWHTNIVILTWSQHQKLKCPPLQSPSPSSCIAKVTSAQGQRMDTLACLQPPTYLVKNSAHLCNLKLHFTSKLG